jgi:hypothetical protein
MVLVVLKPVNFKDFEDEKELNDWIKDFGFEKVWFNNSKFWSREHTGIDISERVTNWADIPDVPLL